jgi:hypothetical protein
MPVRCTGSEKSTFRRIALILPEVHKNLNVVVPLGLSLELNQNKNKMVTKFYMWIWQIHFQLFFI